MNDLPILPFEKILSYLSLQDLIKTRAVSRRWYMTINGFKVKSLCFAGRQSVFDRSARRSVGDELVQNFIRSSGFLRFVKVYRKSMLSNLKHLHLRDLRVDLKNGTSSLAQALNSFGQLEKLDIICFNENHDIHLERKLRLSLPMLTSIHLDCVFEIGKLTLEAPKLQKVEIHNLDGQLKLDFVHGESVERLITDDLDAIRLDQLKNLKYLGSQYNLGITPNDLSYLGQLKEFHTDNSGCVYDLVRYLSKQPGRCAGLKICYFGMALNDPEEVRILDGDEAFSHWAANSSRLTDEILVHYGPVRYAVIDRVAAELQADFLKRFGDLHRIVVDKPVQDVQRFLDFLERFDRIVDLEFLSAQPQELFDRLPDHCAAESLDIYEEVSDFGFLFKLKDLTEIHIDFSISIELIRKILKEVELLSRFSFATDIGCEVRVDHQKLFEVSILPGRKKRSFSNVDGAIEFIIKKAC